jgi:putative membrane protein
MNRSFLPVATLAAPLLFAMPAIAQTAPPGGALPPAAPPEVVNGAGPSAAAALPPAGAGRLSAADQAFVQKAAQGGIAEVQLAQLAQQKTGSDQVKQFAQKMIDDHTPNNEELVKLATAEGITPPSEPNVQQQKMAQHPGSLSGTKFDHAYMRGQVQAHMEMLKLFQAEASSGHDERLKAFAGQTVPTIQEHLSMAQQLRRAGA